MVTEKIDPNKLLPVSVFLILLATLTPGNGKILGDYLDKLVHFLLFAGLSANIFYCGFKPHKRNIALILAFGLAILTEVLQQFIPGRNMDIIDGVADLLGILAGFLFFKLNH